MYRPNKKIKVIMLYSDRRTFIPELKKIINSLIDELSTSNNKSYLIKYYMQIEDEVAYKNIN